MFSHPHSFPSIIPFPEFRFKVSRVPGLPTTEDTSSRSPDDEKHGFCLRYFFSGTSNKWVVGITTLILVMVMPLLSQALAMSPEVVDGKTVDLSSVGPFGFLACVRKGGWTVYLIWNILVIGRNFSHHRFGKDNTTG